MGIHSCHTVARRAACSQAVTRASGGRHVPRDRPDVSSLLRVVTFLAPGLLPRFIGLVIMSRMVGAAVGI